MTIMEKDFHDHDAIDKLKSLAGDIRFCMYTTFENGRIQSKPMTAQDIDSDGNIWFFASRKDNSASQTLAPADVTLIYSDPGKSSYLSISGTAEAVEDEKKKEELWNPMAKAWFQDGKDDPDLLMIRVNTEEASYWDSGSSKMIVFFSMIKAAITGSTPDGGDHGTLDLG
jgi:general stress protein 26